VPSLFRHFSAPINLEAPYTDEQLEHLMIHDSDGFNQWEAGNRFLTGKMLEQIDRYEAGQEIVVGQEVVDAFRGILARTDMDQELMSLALSLPVYSELAPKRSVIDPQAITAVRKEFLETIGRELHDEFLNVYQNNYDSDKEYTLEDASRRAMQNTALGYLAKSGDSDHAKLAVKQYSQANNMTDLNAALSVIINSDDAEPYREGISQNFYYRYEKDALVVDKWVAALARSSSDDILDIVKGLTQHDSFSDPSPNRMRSLYGVFSQGNPTGFHAEDGSGYEFVADYIIDLDAKNPQIAAGMISAFEEFRQYRSDLQDLMETQLRRIGSMDKVSTDLSEKLEAYLGKATYAQLRSANQNQAAPQTNVANP